MATSAPARPPGPRPRERGQATVETVGIIVAVALLLTATAAWLSGAVSVPARPPDLIGALTRVFDGDESPAEPKPGIEVPGPGGFVRADHASILPPRPEPPIGRGIRWVGGRAVSAAGVLVPAATLIGDMNRAFIEGAVERAGQRARELLLDPASLIRNVREMLLNPEAALAAALPDVRGLVGYAKSLLSMSARRALLRLSRDAGARAADEVIAYLLRNAGRAATRRLGGARAPAPPDDRAPRVMR